MCCRREGLAVRGLCSMLARTKSDSQSSHRRLLQRRTYSHLTKGEQHEAVQGIQAPVWINRGCQARMVVARFLFYLFLVDGKKNVGP